MRPQPDHLRGVNDGDAVEGTRERGAIRSDLLSLRCFASIYASLFEADDAGNILTSPAGTAIEVGQR